MIKSLGFGYCLSGFKVTERCCKHHAKQFISLLCGIITHLMVFVSVIKKALDLTLQALYLLLHSYNLKGIVHDGRKGSDGFHSV
jgi:hypothetical protein